MADASRNLKVVLILLCLSPTLQNGICKPYRWPIGLYIRNIRRIKRFVTLQRYLWH